MTGKRTRYSADFKAKVALEALRGELTAVQLAAKHGIHQTMVGEWKRQAMGDAQGAGLAGVEHHGGGVLSRGAGGGPGSVQSAGDLQYRQ
jgi:transposase-like protein